MRITADIEHFNRGVDVNIRTADYDLSQNDKIMMVRLKSLAAKREIIRQAHLNYNMNLPLQMGKGVTFRNSFVRLAGRGTS